MKTIKTINLLESGSSKQFATSNGRPISRTNPDLNKAPIVEPVGALGFKSTNKISKSEKTKDQEEVVEEASNKRREVIKLKSKHQDAETADAMVDPSQGGGSSTNTTVSDIVGQNSLIDVFTGILSRQDPKHPSKLVCDMYRDMYYQDATSGSAIDLYATMPFSDFSLVGLKDEKMTKVFVESIEALHTSTLLPNITVDYNVLGGSTLSLKWDEGEKKFTGVTAHAMDDCFFTPVPVLGIDPLISVQIPPEMLDGFKDPRVLERYSKYIPDELLAAFQDNRRSSSSKDTGIELNPERTIFIPRRAVMKDFSGVSILKRALAAWIYEKALIRGTLDQVYKRQRAIGHITVEYSDDWVPTQDQMNAIAQLFMNADLDPLGSTIVTRSGVNYNEVRRGDDFLKWTDAFDVIEKIKLRALGISENFIGADVSYNTMEQSLSVFMEGVRDYRNRITREIFYEKIFPTISNAHGFTRKRYGNVAREFASYGNTNAGYDKNGLLVVNIGSDMPMHGEFGSLSAGINASDFVIPNLAYHKRLMPEADGDYLAIMDTLEQHGIPVSIRHWIAAGGMKIEALMDGLDQDLEDREKIFEYKKELADLEKEYGVQPPPVGGEGGFGGEEGQGDGSDGGGDSEEFANFITKRRLGIGGVRRRSILSRGNPDSQAAEVADFDSTGKRRYITKRGRQIKLNKYNKMVAEVAAELGRKENARNKLEESKREVTKKFYTQ